MQGAHAHTVQSGEGCSSAHLHLPYCAQCSGRHTRKRRNKLAQPCASSLPICTRRKGACVYTDLMRMCAQRAYGLIVTVMAAAAAAVVPRLVRPVLVLQQQQQQQPAGAAARRGAIGLMQRHQHGTS